VGRRDSNESRQLAQGLSVFTRDELRCWLV
jgi:hypothetical protein